MEIKSGVLSKRGSGFPFNWLDRKFILYNDKIEYYAGTVLKGEFILTAESKAASLRRVDLAHFVFQHALLMTVPDEQKITSCY